MTVPAVGRAASAHRPRPRLSPDAPLILLDEPTANLDGDTEAGILDAIRDLARGRTVIMAAHRPSLIAIADREIRLASAAVTA